MIERNHDQTPPVRGPAVEPVTVRAHSAGLRRCAGLLTSCVLVLIAGCHFLAPKFTKPDFSVVTIEMEGGNFLRQNFRVKLNVHNPNDRTLPVTRLHVELNIAGEQVATGVNTTPFVVPAQGDTQFEMEISANMALALLKLAGRKDQHADSIEYDMTGGASIDLPFLRDLPFRQHGVMSLKGP